MRLFGLVIISAKEHERLKVKDKAFELFHTYTESINKKLDYLYRVDNMEWIKTGLCLQERDLIVEAHRIRSEAIQTINTHLLSITAGITGRGLKQTKKQMIDSLVKALEVAEERAIRTNEAISEQWDRVREVQERINSMDKPNITWVEKEGETK